MPHRFCENGGFFSVALDTCTKETLNKAKARQVVRVMRIFFITRRHIGPIARAEFPLIWVFTPIFAPYAALQTELSIERSNAFFAITRLASANKVSQCAPFLANPR
jgi:hypothetical protein